MTKRISLIALAISAVLFSCKHMPTDMDWDDGTYSPVIVPLSCNEDTIFFQEQILPIFISSCAMTDCHDVESHEEGLILDTYENIMDSDEITPGNPYDGDIFESITENLGDDDLMPPLDDGGPLSEQQIDLIVAWIAQGALNTSCPNLMCDTLEVTFSDDIWPITENACEGCHSGSNPDGDLYLENHADLVSSFESDPALFLALIDGTEDPVMPENTTGLSDCQVRMFEIWMENGMLDD